MFICKDCISEDQDWLFGAIYTSLGNCEVCGKNKVCVDAKKEQIELRNKEQGNA